MIFITGDTHMPIDIKKLDNQFYEEMFMSKKDYVIICGDFGGVWDKSAERLSCLNKLNNKKYTTLFIDGNHENFDLLNSFEVIPWCGGKVHKIKNSIYHLMRGQVYTIEDKTFFTMGGANSTDKMYRTPHSSWWSQEMPAAEEYNEARENLKKADYKVDYILTHTAPLSIIEAFYEPYDELPLNLFLEEIKDTVAFKHWYFGHVHKDITINDRFTALFNKIIQIK